MGDSSISLASLCPHDGNELSSRASLPNLSPHDGRGCPVTAPQERWGLGPGWGQRSLLPFSLHNREGKSWTHRHKQPWKLTCRREGGKNVVWEDLERMLQKCPFPPVFPPFLHNHLPPKSAHTHPALDSIPAGPQTLLHSARSSEPETQHGLSTSARPLSVGLWTI